MDYYHCELRRFRHFLQRNFPGILRDGTQDNWGQINVTHVALPLSLGYKFYK